MPLPEAAIITGTAHLRQPAHLLDGQLALRFGLRPDFGVDAWIARRLVGLAIPVHSVQGSGEKIKFRRFLSQRLLQLLVFPSQPHFYRIGCGLATIVGVLLLRPSSN